jgi:hypothetical protein
MSGIRDHRLVATLSLTCVMSCATAPKPFSHGDQSWTFPRRPTGAAAESAPQSGGRVLGNVTAPRVSISATVASYAASRRVHASLRVDDDAYVLVGHLGADGVVRIVFPLEPTDNGFVRGGHNYDVPEFFAGFEDAFNYRAAYDLSLRGFTPARYDSYDGGTGYVFVIASWQPMRFEQFMENDRWQSFEVADDQYLRDPRPAIEEFAAFLTGESRDAYTVRYARYYNTYYFPAPVFTGYATYSSYCSDFGSGFSSPYYYGIAARHGLISRYGSLGFPYNRYGSGCYSPYTIPRGYLQLPRIAAAAPINPYGEGRPRTPVPRVPLQPRGTPLYPRKVGPDDTNAGTPGVDYRRRDLTVPDATEPGRRAAPRDPALREAPTAVNRPRVQDPADLPRIRAIDPDERSTRVEHQPKPPRERSTEAQSTAPRAPRTEPREGPRAAPRAAPREPASREPREVPRERAPEPKSEPVRSAPPTPPPASRPVRPPG